MDASGPPELNATHPLLSLIAAVFWALRTYPNFLRVPPLTCFKSMAPVMGQVAHCVRNHLRTTIYLRSRVLFLHVHGELSIVSLKLWPHN